MDLAGSERLNKTGASGKTMKEGQKINLSLKNNKLKKCLKFKQFNKVPKI